jgi:hypothetical protein
MHFRLFAALLAMLAIAPAHAAERSYLVGSFEEVIVEGDLQVTLEMGKAPSAKASGDKKGLSALKIERQGRVVRIRMAGLQVGPKAAEPIKIAMTGRDVRKLILRGNGRITVNDVNMTDVRVDLRGSGEINIANLKSERLVVLLVGSGKLNITKGTATDGQFTIDGASNIDAAGLKLKELKLTQNGPADTHFSVEEMAEITNSGTGTITVDGDASCFVRQAGGAAIKCKNIGK